MSWLIHFGTVTVSSDDFLIEDLETIEKTTGTPWSMANPLREVKVAKAFLAVALIRAGQSEDEVARILKKLTLKALRRAFEWVKDEDEDQAEEVGEDDPLLEGRTIPGSLPGAKGKAGRRRSSGSSD